MQSTCIRCWARSASLPTARSATFPMIARGFQLLAAAIVPSHAYVHVVDFGLHVEVAGKAVKGGGLIHADRHGAIVVPDDAIDAVPAAVERLAVTEAWITTAAKPGGG